MRRDCVGPPPERPKSALDVSFQLSAAVRGNMRHYEAIVNALHAARCLETGLREFVPACDRDMR
jgi:hypothetical protein